MLGAQVYGTFALPSQTQSAGTAIVSLVPPYRGSGGNPPLLYKLDKNQKPNWEKAFTHLSQLTYTAAGTAHTVVVMRPLNWTTIASAVAHNSTSVVLTADPGVYSTNYKYALPTEASGKPSGVADNGIAANDYVAFQLKDGTWHVSTVGSVSSLTLTLSTGTPNVAGGGAVAGTPLFFFGVAGDSDPATKSTHVSFLSVANARTELISDKTFGDVSSLNPGDPLLIYSANASNAGTLAVAVGFYAGY